jgi:hypothetical protein
MLFPLTQERRAQGLDFHDYVKLVQIVNIGKLPNSIKRPNDL